MTPNPSLPDDLLLNCFARVSRLHYPTLSLVSKTFRSLLASPELYKARSLLAHTENCLYVCLELYPYINSTWFVLSRQPDHKKKSKKKKKSSSYVLATVPTPRSPPARVSGLVSVGSNIYNIGGSGSGSSSSVWVLDCGSHTWHEAPSLKVELLLLSANILDDKIYVVGRCKEVGSDSLKDSYEVFDTKTQTWYLEPLPCHEIKDRFYSKTACIDGKFHVVASEEVIAYDPKEGRWDSVPSEMNYHVYSGCYCVIENVLFSINHGSLEWYDTEVFIWRPLKGLVGLPKFPPCARFRLADYGGKMAVLWDKILPSSGPGGTYKKEIWCAVITLEMCVSCENCDIWGTVEWYDNVLTFFEFCDFVDVLAATV